MRYKHDTNLQRIEYIIFGTVKIILLIREFCSVCHFPQELLSKAMSDYELIDEFFYTLSNEDFNGK